MFSSATIRTARIQILRIHFFFRLHNAFVQRSMTQCVYGTSLWASATSLGASSASRSSTAPAPVHVPRSAYPIVDALLPVHPLIEASTNNYGRAESPQAT